MKTMWASKTLWIILLLMLSLAGTVWWQRNEILAWYHVRQLAYADEENRVSCARQAAELEEAALPRLIQGMHDADAIICANMQTALGFMAARWGAQDVRTQHLMTRLQEQFDEFSLPGQEKCLQLMTCLLQDENARPWPAHVTRGMGELMLMAEKKPELRAYSLLLAAQLLDCVADGQWVDACQKMVERGLEDPLCGTRVAAVQLLMRESMRKDKNLMLKVVPLLQDREAVVRRSALLALASEVDVVREDTLMTLLHDEDGEVQYWCEQALRTRNLTEDGIKVARLVTDKNPVARMRVLQYLSQMPELNLVEWLRQLSQDPTPAVRAAAVRAAGENPALDLSDRLQEMANQDPSETVRLNARFYLRQRGSLRAMNDR